MTDIKIKRGSSLSLTLAVANADGSAFDLSTVSVAGSVRDPRGNFVAALSVTLGSSLGVATVSVANTTNWPLGNLTADLLFVAAGQQVISQSFAIRVERGATWLSADPGSYNPITQMSMSNAGGGVGGVVMPPLVLGTAGQTITGTAAVSVSGYMAVSASSAGLSPADSTNAALAGSVIGVATNGANAGATVTVQAQGPVSFNGWSWIPGEPVFVGAAGVLTQSPPSVGFSQVIGVAETATTLIVDLSSPVLL
jgi:hypothetical protein